MLCWHSIRKKMAEHSIDSYHTPFSKLIHYFFLTMQGYESICFVHKSFRISSHVFTGLFLRCWSSESSYHVGYWSVSASTSLRNVVPPTSRRLNLVQVAAEVSEGRENLLILEERAASFPVWLHNIQERQENISMRWISPQEQHTQKKLLILEVPFINLACKRIKVHGIFIDMLRFYIVTN